MTSAHLDSLLNTPQAPLAWRLIYAYDCFPSHAAIFIDGEQHTYYQLMSLVAGYYQYIHQLAIDDKKHIVVVAHSTLQTYAAIYAISLYGAAYIPVHPHISAQQLLHIQDETGSQIVMDTNTLRIELIGDIDSVRTMQILQPLAYIIYTSGTTAEPKGIAITKEQANLYLNLPFVENWYQIDASDRFIQAFELSFDASIQWLYTPACVGACLYVPTQTIARPVAIMTMIEEHELTVCAMVPTVVAFMKPYWKELCFPKLRYTLFGGEVLEKPLVQAWKKIAPNSVIENLYGPTEATIWCSRYRLNMGEKAIPIGSPNTGVSFQLLNKHNDEGELCIAGDQVITHYYQDKYHHAFVEINHKRYYRTGDIVEQTADGLFYFKGRVDHQLKINGYRIEPLYIESVILEKMGYRAIVVGVKTSRGFDCLGALLEGNTTEDLDDMQAKLGLVLPSYQIPVVWKYTIQLPCNNNGKLDRLSALKMMQDE